MAILTNTNNPSFVLFEVNNNRTGYKAFGLPVIMVVPNKRDLNDNPISNSQVFNVRIFIEDVPRKARVAGHDHVGMLFPDRELFAETIDSFGLAERMINVNQYKITRNGEEILYSEAKEGDLFIYITSTGVEDTVPYLPGANYYDLSDITIDFEHLPPDQYNFVYQTKYFTRIISEDNRNELLCIDPSITSLAILRFNVSHPGEVLEEFERHTPPPYLTDAIRSKDTTLALYRPFTDIMQDIMDEQDLLESINWVFETPAEAIPYLSQLLGWDLPYFPESLDKLRRAVLRRTVEFQNLAGSRRAIINIFRLFGFEILISNLWWSSDGKRLIRPNKDLSPPYEAQKIDINECCQIDLVLSNWNDGGFGVFQIPLIFRPQEQHGLDDFTALRDGGNVSIDCYFVETDSDAYYKLTEISQDIQDDPIYYGNNSGGCSINSEEYLIPIDITNKLSRLDVVGYSRILVSGKLGQAISEVVSGAEIPLRKEGVSINRETNILNLTLNGALDVVGRINKSSRSVFVFVTYKRQEFVVPDIIKELQSNRFDIQVITQDLTERADPVFLEFAIEFLYRLKAFHSLLNKIIFRIELTETYEVTDFCVGGDITQRFDTDAGTLQVPPAIIPDIPNDITDCTKLDPNSLGYKTDDITLRLRKLANLPEEHAIWKSLDARADQPTGLTRLALMDIAPGRTECKFAHRGQDRVVGDRVDLRTTEIGPSPNTNSMAHGFGSNPELSPVDLINNGQFDTADGTSNNDSSSYGSFTREYTDIRQPHCDIDNITDYYYKGRVDGELLYRPTLIAGDIIRCKPCSVDLGFGVYYVYPTISKMTVPGVTRPCLNSLTSHSQFSGGAPGGNQKQHLNGIQQEYLTAPYDEPLSNNSHLARLYRDYNSLSEETLHFTNRPQQFVVDQQLQLALQRPSLNIQKPTLHFPGCRFPQIDALQEDFFHPTWDARPWDEEYNINCGPACGSTSHFLNYYKIIGDDNNEYLVFDNLPFQILGNNFVPDIRSLGDHTLGTDALFDTSDIIHAVYMTGASDNPAIILDGVSSKDRIFAPEFAPEFGWGVGEEEITDMDRPGVFVIENPLFTSHNSCADEMIDFADGYANKSGELNYNGDDLGRDGLYDEILDALGVPPPSGTHTLLIFLGSGILDGTGIRLDCGCLLIQCESDTTSSTYVDDDDNNDNNVFAIEFAEEFGNANITIDNGIEETICSADDFINHNGYYDWECDHLQAISAMRLEEPLGVCSIQLDGEIACLLETTS